MDEENRGTGERGGHVPGQSEREEEGAAHAQMVTRIIHHLLHSAM